MERADVVIVGAGYAGLAAALQLHGKKVIVLERHPSVLEKRRGSLGLALGLGEQAAVRGEDLYLQGLELLVEGGVKTNLQRLELRGQRERLEMDCRLVLIDESRLKGALLRRLLEVGGEVYTGCAVRQVVAEGRGFRVRAENDFEARVLIGADGSNSQVSRSLGFKRERGGLLFAREVEVSSLDLPAQTLLIQFDGAGQVFFAVREGERCRAALIEIRGPREAPGNLQAVLEDRLQRLGGGRILHASPALVHLYRPGSDFCRPGVLLAGDAAAAWSLSTITGALAAGRLAGQVAARLLAASRYALADYRRQWRKVSGQPTLEWAGRLLRLAASLDGQRVDRLLRLFGRPDGRPASLAMLLWRLPRLAWYLLP